MLDMLCRSTRVKSRFQLHDAHGTCVTSDRLHAIKQYESILLIFHSIDTDSSILCDVSKHLASCHSVQTSKLNKKHTALHNVTPSSTILNLCKISQQDAGIAENESLLLVCEANSIQVAGNLVQRLHTLE